MKDKLIVSLAFIGALFAGAEAVAKGRGSCSYLDQCCPGRDASCIVTGRQTNGAYVRTPCYCDEGCMETGDCCDDYKEVCSVKVVDCEVSQWSEWGACDTSCGRGTQKRNRLIVRHPTPSGRACPMLDQRRGCEGSRCTKSYWKYKSPIRETAGLLPAKYLSKAQRKKWDVRENLFQHTNMIKKNKSSKKSKYMNNEIEEGYQSDQPMQNDQPSTDLDASDDSYCIVFEMSRSTKSCYEDKDFNKVEKGHKMCALCPKDAKRKHLGYRCKGHGVDYQLTRWRSTFSPKCHGKWRRLYETRDCPCESGPDFIFV